MSINQILLALIVPITWGFGYTLTKIGMDQFTPLLLMSFRFGIAGLILVWFTKPPWEHMRELFKIAFIGSTVQYGLTYYGLKGIDVSTASILLQLEGPILALLSTLILKERLGWPRALGMGLAFAGVFVITGEPRLHDSLDSVFLGDSTNYDQSTEITLGHHYTSLGCDYRYTANAAHLASH